MYIHRISIGLLRKNHIQFFQFFPKNGLPFYTLHADSMEIRTDQFNFCTSVLFQLFKVHLVFETRFLLLDISKLFPLVHV